MSQNFIFNFFCTKKKKEETGVDGEEQEEKEQ